MLISLTAAKTPASTGGSLSGDKLEIRATKVQMGSKPHLNQVFFINPFKIHRKAKIYFEVTY